ncbi:MAG: RHS repeat protein [Candidatus Syntrophonatronum acetioxidans]|uniref:RHS repeat protein n=1 Tax=Candidatus Syntrophonatronum acetioxidans TaxID=1795816 RepID=A0A424Y947_9FIRM|nr:MAG: RHS repeat protein [Candidatus Syntrophonatronum acetioxidans]
MKGNKQSCLISLGWIHLCLSAPVTCSRTEDGSKNKRMLKGYSICTASFLLVFALFLFWWPYLPARANSLIAGDWSGTLTFSETQLADIEAGDFSPPSATSAPFEFSIRADQDGQYIVNTMTKGESMRTFDEPLPVSYNRENNSFSFRYMAPVISVYGHPEQTLDGYFEYNGVIERVGDTLTVNGRVYVTIPGSDDAPYHAFDFQVQKPVPAEIATEEVPPVPGDPAEPAPDGITDDDWGLLGGIGKIPLPDNAAQAAAGILIPGLIAAGLDALGRRGAAAAAAAAGEYAAGNTLPQDPPAADEKDFPDRSPLDSSLFSGLTHGGAADNPYTSFDENPGSCSIQGLPRYMINTASLNLVIQDKIYGFSGLGPPVELTLTYNSGANEQDGCFGRGWSFSYDWQLEHNNNTTILTKGSGQKQIFTYPDKVANHTFPLELTARVGCYDRLLCYGEYWLYMPKGTRFTYRLDQIPGTQQARLTGISDYSGNQQQISFDPQGRISTVTDATGRQVTLQYNENHLLTAFSLPDGRSASFAYDPKGNLIRATDLLGITSDYSYDGAHNLTQMVVGREKHTTRFTYRRGTKEVTALTDARGNITTYDKQSTNPVQVKLTDPAGKVTLYQSKNGLTEKITDPLGHVQEYTYHKRLPIRYRTKGGGTFTFTYDARGNLTEATDRAGNNWRYAYDDHGNQLEAVNPEGGTWHFAYDRHHHLTEETLPTGGVITREYDSRGQQTAVVDPRGHRTTFSYDPFGNPEKITGPLGHTVLFGYDQWGLRLVSFTGPQGQTTSLEHDHNDRLTRVQHPDGSAREHIYNCCADILTTDENGNSSGVERDPLLFVTRAVDRLSNSASFFYDGNNNLLEFTDPTGCKTAYTYDWAGRLTQLIDSLGQKTGFSYDLEGNLTAVEEPSGGKTSFHRDPAALISSETDALGHTVKTRWNSLDMVSEYTGARGHRVTYTYDVAGRMTAKSHDGVEVATYRYDSAANLLELQDVSGTTAYSYNEEEQLLSITYPEGLQIKYEYDRSGRLAALHYPTGLTVHYSYDSRHRLTGIHWDENKVSFSYDAVGNLLEQQRSNGTLTRYTLNRNYRLVGLEHLQNGEPFCRINYTRDEAGNLVKEEGEYPLAFPSPLKRVRITFNELNQMVSFNGKPCRYDPDGNLLEIEGGLWQAAYDPENRLKSLTRNGKSHTNDYDGLGRRYRAGTGSAFRRFYWDQEGRVLWEKDQKGDLICYIYTGKVLVAAVRPGQKTLFYHFDKTGNTIALTDSAGRIRAAYSYTPFGESASTGETAGNPFTYVGAYGVMDEGGGLYLMKRRYYDALSGRFVQKDPTGIWGGINRYAYAHNNPLLYIDPEGTLGVVELLFACALVGGALTATTMTGLTYESGEATDRVMQLQDAADKVHAREIKEFSRGNYDAYKRLNEHRREILDGVYPEVRDMGELALKQHISNIVGGASPEGGVGYTVGEAVLESTQSEGPSRWDSIKDWITSPFTSSKKDPCK